MTTIYTGGNFYVIGDYSDTVLSSIDGTTWVTNTGVLPNSTSNWAFASTGYPDIAVVSDGGGAVAFSPDAVNWGVGSVLTGELNTTVKVVAWSGVKFVAIADTYTATSSDGLDWITHASVLPTVVGNIWTAITWNGSLFCVISSDGRSAVSSDGIAWTDYGTVLPSPPGGGWTGLSWNGSVFLVVGAGTRATVTSPDGATWTNHATALPVATTWGKPVWNGTTFCVVSVNFGTVSATSTDGITWTEGTIPFDANWRDLAWNGASFCALCVSTGGDVLKVLTSTTGLSWTAVTITAGPWRAIFTGPTAPLLPPLPGWTVELPFISPTLFVGSGGSLVVAPPLMNIQATSHANTPNSITGGFIDTYLTTTSGARVTGLFGNPALASTGTVLDRITASLGLFTSTLSAGVTIVGRGSFGFGFTSSTLVARGGSSLALSTPNFALGSTATVVSTGKGALDFPAFSISSTGTYQQHGSITGGFIITYLSYTNITLSAPSFALSASGSVLTANAVAYVLNMHSAETTRYTNYSFNHIVHIGGTAYGVRDDGLYELAGLSDISTPITGIVSTKETDLGDFHSKRLQFAYLDTDTPVTITPFVDGVQRLPHTSTFKGRKGKMALGNSGRYHRLTISGIKKLEGLELVPSELTRRVK